MNKNTLLHFTAFLAAILIFSSCATTHPNEQLIVGTWKPEKVEKWVDPNSAPEAKTEVTAPQTIKVKSADTSRKSGDQGKGAVTAVDPRMEDALQRLMRVEERTNLEVFANKMATKSYPAKTVKATWKIKGKDGTKFVAKNIQTKEKTNFTLLELNESRVVLVEHTRAGDLKITYVKL
jgi:hypothetical protein